ncbi:MAG: arginyl-tRNA synthetase [Cellvibrionaceae bacterium]|jgi:arginyl-tRNA synthetase
MIIHQQLSQRFKAAMIAAGIPGECQPHIAPSKRVGSGDYQANGAMAAAKHLRKNPLDVARDIVTCLQIDDMASAVDISGPGFINITLSNEWLAEAVEHYRQAYEKALRANSQQTVVVDYSSPNLAKEMHVGHLRSTIIGDAMVRILEKQGHRVIRQNHVGDWGTQFGMLLVELETHLQQGEPASLALKDLESFYRQAKQTFDASEAFADKARETVVKLQSGDPQTLSLWQQFKTVSLAHSQEIYNKLNVTLCLEDIRGESAYNDDLSILVKELRDKGLAKEDQGALVVFLEELANKDGRPSPVIVQKQGGGYLYSTSDLAALRYRQNTIHADRILYFIDARQSLHMQQMFTIARKAGFVDAAVSLEHHAFGTMMNDDGKPIKTRRGGTIKLAELLDEAIERADALVREKSSDLSEAQYREIAKKVGIGAVKYADLSKVRTGDYLFNWDSMLSFEGNTAPYLQYAYTRIQSIFRKAEQSPQQINGPFKIAQPDEKKLSIKLLQFPETIQQVSQDAYPHLLCTYLYDLASLYMRFYENCPILKDSVSKVDRSSRLLLCDATGKTLKLGLELLGIETMEKM